MVVVLLLVVMVVLVVRNRMEGFVLVVINEDRSDECDIRNNEQSFGVEKSALPFIFETTLDQLTRLKLISVHRDFFVIIMITPL